MGILIALLGVVLILCVCDVRMRLAYYLNPRDRFAVMSRMQNWGLRGIVAVVKNLPFFHAMLGEILAAACSIELSLDRMFFIYKILMDAR